MRTLTVLLLLLAPFALASNDNYSTRLHQLSQGDVSALGVIHTSQRIASVRCHCTGGWSELPDLEIISMQTGESYVAAVCEAGKNPVTNSKMVIPPSRKVPGGVHLGVKITNAPRPRREEGHPVKGHYCTTTVRMKKGL